MKFYEYLQAYDAYFWNWQEEAEVACLANGSTIAYRAFINEVLALLAEQGLPPFGALLLTLVATNKSVDDGVSWVQQAIQQEQQSYDGESVTAVIDFLRILQKLPEAYKEGNKRIQVLQVLFEKCHNGLGLKNSKEIVSDLKRFDLNHKGNLIEKLSRKLPYNRSVFQKDFRAIELMHRHFGGTVDIINAVAGLPTINESALLIEKSFEEVAVATFTKDWVNELKADARTFPVGALIPRIWSGLRIPFHHTVPSQQPLGGVSDLSNKGDFDRLLISEFANDDMVLLSRLANNEALYLQREIPPTKNEEERIILIDVSLRNWGTPKLIAFAIALAVARHPKTDIPCRIFCVGNNCILAKADNMEQLVDSLMLVSEGLHAASGIDLFFTEHTDKKKKEILFIGTASAMAYPAVQKIIADHYKWFKYWVTVAQDGSIELFRNQNNSKKFIQHLQLPLEELWAKKETPLQKAPDVDAELPMEYPLLFPQPGKVKKLLYAPNAGHFMIDSERALLKYYNSSLPFKTKGLVLVLPQLPSGADTYAIGKHSNGHYEVLCYSRQKKEAIIIIVGKQEQHIIPFNDWSSSPYPDFFYFKNSFFLRTYGGVYRLKHDNAHPVKKYDDVHSDLEEIYTTVVDIQRRMAVEAIDFGSLLKNVNTVFVGKAGNLVLGKHQLVINSHVIKWTLADTNHRARAVIAEEKVPGRLFAFPCGSTVQIHRSGMLILSSGASAGYGMFDVFLEKTGANILESIKVIKDKTNYGLAKCKLLVDGCPSKLGLALGEYDAQSLIEKIRQTGATAKLIPATAEQVIYIPLVLDRGLGVATDKQFAGNNLYYIDEVPEPLTVIPPAQFFEKNIKAFTQYILDHGA